MNAIIDIKNITTNIETGVTSITLIEDKLPITTIIEEVVDISMIDVGIQGPVGPTGVGIDIDWDGTSLGVKREDDQAFEYVDLKGPKGDNINYNNLTLDEKTEIINQYDNLLGNTSYANIFLNTLLS